jgi:hypothetical protein
MSPAVPRPLTDSPTCAYRHHVLRGVIACLIALTVAGCASSSNAPIRVATIARVKTVFAQHGMPLVASGNAKIAGQRVNEFSNDPASLVTKDAAGNITSLTGAWLVVLVFGNASAAAHALHDSREVRAIRSFALTVVARGNVVGAISRGDATDDRLERVRSAVHQATSPESTASIPARSVGEHLRALAGPRSQLGWWQTASMLLPSGSRMYPP